MSRFVVTGGAGFIGSQLVRSLLSAGAHSVLVVDNLHSGKRENLDGITGALDFEQRNAGDFERLTPLLKGASAVFHLAAIPSVPRSISDPVPSHDYNINSTFHFLRACVEAKTGRVVYAASSSAYGDTLVLPKTESMRPLPKSPYAVQKLVGEYYMSCFSECYGLETVSLRFFNVFGPRQDPTSQYSGVLSVFITALLDRRAPTIYGDGEQTRDFTYVEDVAGLCIKASQAPAASGKMYNAGNGGRHSLNRIWSILCDMEGVRIDPVYQPPRPGDVRDSQADTAAAVRDLGHAPRFSIEEGLRHTLEWYRSQRRS